MPRTSLKSFYGMIVTTDTKDIPQDVCREMRNMVCEPHFYATRCGCVKLSNIPLSEGAINLVYNLERKPSGNKTIIQSGTKLYVNE